MSDDPCKELKEKLREMIDKIYPEEKPRKTIKEHLTDLQENPITIPDLPNLTEEELKDFRELQKTIDQFIKLGCDK